jgi:hypothetical protein
MAGIATAAGWRAAALSAALLGFVALASVVLLRGMLNAPAAAHPAGASHDTQSSPFAFLRVTAVWMCFLFFLTSTMGISALQNFAPSVLNHVYGLPLTAAASALTVFLLFGAAGIAAVFGFCTGTATPSRDLLVRRAAMERFGQRSFGRIYGFVYSGLDTGLAVAPVLFGPLLDRGMFTAVLYGVALFQGLAVLAALRVGQARVEMAAAVQPQSRA